MAKKTKIVLIVVVVFVGALAAAFYAFNRSEVGLPAFLVWKAVSGKAHGGQYADINGIRIYYETYGTGRPVLVVHGGTGAIEFMHYQEALRDALPYFLEFCMAAGADARLKQVYESLFVTVAVDSQVSLPQGASDRFSHSSDRESVRG